MLLLLILDMAYTEYVAEHFKSSRLPNKYAMNVSVLMKMNWESR